MYMICTVPPAVKLSLSGDSESSETQYILKLVIKSWVATIFAGSFSQFSDLKKRLMISKKYVLALLW